MEIRGTVTKYSPDLSQKIWRQEFNTGDYPGGKYQFTGAVPSFKSLIYTECWGLSKVLNPEKNLIGWIAGCGSGVEPGCDHHSVPVIKNKS